MPDKVRPLQARERLTGKTCAAPGIVGPTANDLKSFGPISSRDRQDRKCWVKYVPHGDGAGH